MINFRFIAAIAFAGVLACKPASSLPRTDPSKWSTSGWQTFRWGMGPGDVERVLREAKGDLSALRIKALPNLIHGSEGRSVDSVTLGPQHRLEIAGAPCTVTFVFHKGELMSVRLKPEGLSEWADDRRWQKQVIDRLAERYGAPEKDEKLVCTREAKGGPYLDCNEARSDDPDYNLRIATWTRDELVVTLHGSPGWAATPPRGDEGAHRRIDLAVHYDDPQRDRLSSGDDPADVKKL